LGGNKGDPDQTLGRRMLEKLKQILNRLPPFQEPPSDCEQSPESRQSQEPRQSPEPKLSPEPQQDRVFFPPGHYYSPIPSQREVRARERAIWGAPPRKLRSIELNEERQVALFKEFKKYYKAIPFGDSPKDGLRYYFKNDWFGYGDAVVLYCMIRHVKPKRIIEIGSGFSSAVILDTNDLFFDGTIGCTFVEPNPERLFSLLKDSDRGRHSVIPTQLQNVDLALFTQLSANDILFVDSSHVAKVDSDVNRVFFDILPILGGNVIVHFHDVFYPFEYPKEWVYEGRAWNEDYMLRAFLQYNKAFQVEFFNTFFAYFYRDLLLGDMPLCLNDPGGSIWLKKVDGDRRVTAAD
jgi:hypothetical protein